MARITLDLPDWTDDGYIKIISNTELVAYREHGTDRPWMVKVGRCSKCGECCLNVGAGFPYADDEGKCSARL